MAQHILVVDDDRQIVRLVRAYLEQAGYTVAVAYDGNEVLPAVRHARPDLIVLDLMLPGRDGWELTRLLRGDPTLASIPILMLTARVEDTDKIVGLELGADDYVTKPFNPRELVARVRAILRRVSGAEPAPRLLRAGAIALDPHRHEVTLNGQPVDLTPAEFDILRALLEQPDRTLTRSELIERAFGYSYEGLERTVDSHIKNLRRKLEEDPRQPRYIQTVYGVGYRLKGDA
jgi:DNA-binding response OmpR family regulator